MSKKWVPQPGQVVRVASVQDLYVKVLVRKSIGWQMAWECSHGGVEYEKDLRPLTKRERGKP